MNITREWFSWKIICKCGGNTSPRPFSKKSKLSIALDQQSKVLYSLFLLYVQVQGYRSLLKGAEHLLLPHIKLFFFFKKKKGYGTSSATLFSAWFLKIFFTLCSINWPNFTVWLSLLLEVWTNMCIVITCYSSCDVQVKINVLAFLSSHSSPWQIQSGQKFKYLKKEKSF